VRSGSAFTITSAIYPSPRCGGPSALLYPGVTRCLVYTVKNNLDVPISVQHITAALDPHYSTPPSGCTPSDVSLPSFSGWLQVSGNGSANSSGLPISLIDTRTNQDNCEHTVLHFVYQGTALYTAKTSTTLTSSPNPSDSGQYVTFAATVTATDAPAAPTGRVNFYACATAACGRTDLLGSAVVGRNGRTSFSTRCLSVGTTYVEAVYEGASTSFSSSTSNRVAQVIKSPVVPTATTLTASPNPSPSGRAVSFTAVVSKASGSGPPTGVVNFSRCPSASNCTTPVLLASESLRSGAATFSTSGLPSGTTYVEAAYAGVPGALGPSTSSVVAQAVVAAPVQTTTNVVSTPDPSAAGQPVTLTATVSPLSGASTPTGPVSFYAGTPTGSHRSLGTVTLNGNAQAALSASGLTVGTGSFFAVYTGSAAFETSTSAIITQQVIASPVPCAPAPFAGYYCIWLGDGPSAITAGDGDLSLVGGDGIDTVVLGNGNDWVTLGNGSQSQLTLGNGDDTVNLGTGSGNVINLGGGSDTITIAGSDDQIHGGSGNEAVYLGSGSGNSYAGGRGHDVCHLPSVPATYRGTAAAYYHDVISDCTVVTP
jgi:Ca2+-binding RTX toxin-like protein